MNIPLLVTVIGPLLGVSGWATNTTWLFWTGAAICTLNLALNVGSGVIKLPVLPVLFMLVAAVLTAPWWLGLGKGLVVWTGLEALGEIYARVQQARRPARDGDA